MVGYVVALVHVATMCGMALLCITKVFRTYRGWHSSGLVIKRVVVMEKSNVAVSQNPLFVPGELRGREVRNRVLVSSTRPPP